jgi:hypothetical protein
MEGKHCYDPEKNCPQQGLQIPIAEYDHGSGISVTGGYVYRGSKMPAMQGKYIFGDWKGAMFYLENGGAWTLNKMSLDGKKDNDLKLNINSFGEDEKGEIYILTQKFTGTFTNNGAVYLLEQK